MTFDELVAGIGNPPIIRGSAGSAVFAKILAPFCNGQPFTFASVDSLVTQNPVVTITGQARFPQVDLSYLAAKTLHVTATLTLTAAGDPDVTLAFDLPAGWTFTDSFVDLPDILLPDPIGNSDNDVHEQVFKQLTGAAGEHLSQAKLVVKSSPDAIGRPASFGSFGITSGHEKLSFIVGTRPAVTVSLKTQLQTAAEIAQDLGTRAEFNEVAAAGVVGGALAIRSKSEEPLTVLDGTANAILGFTNGAVGFAGLSFTAGWTPPDFFFRVLQEALAPNLILAGAVIVPPDAEPPPLGSRFPWEIQNTPGIHLQAHLKDVAFGSGNALNAGLNFQAYSPLLNQWLIDHPGFDPVTGFSGGLAVTGSPKLLTIAALKLPRVDEILLTARGLGVTIPTASAALTNLMGASLPIPAEIHDQFADKFSLESAALFISAGDGASQPFKVEQIAVKLAFGRTVKVAGSAAGTLGFLADPFVGRAIGANVGPFAIDGAHNVLSITVDTTAVADIALPVGGTVTADQIVSALSGSPAFRAVAIAENIGEGVAIASGHEMTPQGWPFHAAATLTDLSVAVLNPFDDDARSIQSRIDGVFALTLGQGHFDLDIGLDIATRLGNGSGAGETTVEIHGEQRGTASVSLSELFHSQAIDGFGTDVSGFTPPQINLTELKFSVSPKTGAYAFSFAIEAGGSWQLGTDANGSSSSNADDHVSTVHFAIARTSGEPAQWQLQAESGNGVAIGALFQNLTNPALPAPLHDVLVKSFSISSTADEEGHTNGFKTECKGEIEIGDPPQTGTDPQPGPLEITVEFDHQSNPASNTFKAGIVLEGMAFDVILNKAQATTGDDSKPPAPVETSDSDTTSFELSNILSRVLPFEDASGLPDLKISLSDVLVFYRKETGVKGRLLFVLDIGAGLKLTDPFSSFLQKFGLLPADGLDLSLRLLAATGAKDPPDLQGFTPDQVGEMNDLLPDGIEKLPTEVRYNDKFAIRKGFDASLKLGPIVFGADSSGAGSNAADGAPGGGGQALAAAAAAGGPAGPSLPASATPAVPATPQVASAASIRWFSLQRSLGPIHFQRVGVAFTGRGAQGRVMFVLDASVTVSGLTLGLDGLSITSPPLLNPASDPLPKLGLDGISLTYQSGSALEISGAFLRDPLIEGRFLGSAVLRTTKLSLTAFGAYGPGSSLFVFAVLDYPLGGPTFFFVTGLAAGFGYNTDLKLPDVASVTTFPFVKAVDGGAASLDLQALSALTPPRSGQYWVGVGLKFTSFQLIQSSALLFVKFGQDLEFVLLGTSEMSLPKNIPGQPPRPAYLHVVMAFRVSVKPAAGEFAAEARLVDGSFVIHPDCRITGGFAFYSWFRPSVHAGDFVLTVGGYHPRFSVPAHYPQVPRLAINWAVSTALSVKGEAYFALTPSCVMAGGALEASYRDGSIQATFTARADFLISWEPYFYDISISLSLTVAVNWETVFGTVRFGTSLSADLEIWGPEFAGKAHVSWSVISFDVAFGAKDTQPGSLRAISWEEFRKAFLPAHTDALGWTATGSERVSQVVDGKTTFVTHDLNASPKAVLQICQVNIESGLDREVEVFEHDSNALRKHWVVLPNSVVFSTQTATPATRIVFQGAEIVTGPAVVANGKSTPVFGIAPMGGIRVETPHVITITSVDTPPVAITSKFVFDTGGRLEKMPKALWHTQQAPPTPSSDLLPEPLLTGLTGLRPVEPTLANATPIPIEAFAFTGLDDFRLPLRPASIPTGFIGGFDPDASTDFGPSVARRRDRRSAIINLAKANGFPALLDERLDRLSQNANAIFQSPPMLGSLGSGDTAQSSVTPAPALPNPAIDQDVITTVVNFLLSILRYPYVSANAVSNTDVGVTTSHLNSSIVISGGSGAVAAATPAAQPAAQPAASPAGVAGTPPKLPNTRTAIGNPSQELTPGQSVVLSVNYTKSTIRPAAALQFTEGLQFRVTTFNTFNEPLDNLVVGSVDHPERRFTITSDTVRVIVTALAVAPAASPLPAPLAPPVAANQTTFGWTGTSSLIQFGPQFFVADGASVQIQSAFQQSDNLNSVVRGAAMVRANQVVVPGTDGNRTASGAFVTLLPADVLTFAVLVRRSAATAQEGLGTLVQVTRADGAKLRLQPLHSLHDDADQFALFYRVPRNLQIQNGKVAVSAQATGGAAGEWEIQGVMGITQKPDVVVGDWATFRLRPSEIVQQVLQQPVPVASAKAAMTVVAA